jgi:8-oxo-dGTP pyrophosphatase MutT (NUDIX family)
LKLEAKKSVFQSPIFNIEELSVRSKKGELLSPRYRLTCGDWANVLPITREGSAVLIEQLRFGSMANVLETPGGMMDPDEKDPMLAAVRELEEETGYTSMRILSLGSFNPNPAIMGNRIHFFLALDCVLQENRTHFQDLDEEITLKLVDPNELVSLVRLGRIDHALSALCISLASYYLVDVRK